MANVLVKGGIDDPSPPEFGVVQLNGAQDESDQTKQEDQPTNAWKEFSREMRQKEGWQPLRSWTIQRPSEQRIVDRVVVESEWSDHEEHFQRDKQIG
jgi:hypothetical protein